MKHVRILITAVAMVSCSSHDVPAAVKTSFEHIFPNTTVKKWDKENDNYEANFSKDGKEMSATFDVSGNWKETESTIATSELPAPALAYIQTNYSNDKIKEAAILQTPGGNQYEAEVNGKDLVFDANGNFLKNED